MPLYVCATPIGNLEDVSRRLARTLTEADLVLAEDTRRTGKLLASLGISVPMESFHQHSEERKSGHVLGLLKEGKSIALLTDSGTPVISDPGGRLVQGAHVQGIKVIPVPGPCAVTAALSAAGMPADRFSFLGFPPKKGRERFFSSAMGLGETVVLYESPYRVKKTLEDIGRIDPVRRVAVCRELTKAFEEILQGTAGQLSTTVRQKGEFVIIIEKKKGKIT